MSLSLKASADGLSLDLLLGATLVATFSTSGIEAGTLIASDAEAQGFTNLKKLLTPEKLAKAFQGSNQTIAANGYQKLPGGLILQWGSATGINNSAATNITFPIAFPNACRSVVATHVSPTGPVSRIVEVLIQTPTYFDARSNTTSNAIYWFAIGY